jgi:hypothetical protein
VGLGLSRNRLGVRELYFPRARPDGSYGWSQRDAPGGAVKLGEVLMEYHWGRVFATPLGRDCARVCRRDLGVSRFVTKHIHVCHLYGRSNEVRRCTS